MFPFCLVSRAAQSERVLVHRGRVRAASRCLLQEEEGKKSKQTKICLIEFRQRRCVKQLKEQGAAAQERRRKRRISRATTRACRLGLGARGRRGSAERCPDLLSLSLSPTHTRRRRSPSRRRISRSGGRGRGTLGGEIEGNGCGEGDGERSPTGNLFWSTQSADTQGAGKPITV